EVLDDQAGAARNAGERVLGDPDRDVDLLADGAVDAAYERAASRHGDAALREVGGELGRRLLERLLDGVDDGVEGLLHGLADLLAGDGHLAGHHGHDVAAADLEGQLLLEGIQGADVDLDALGGLLADLQVVGAAEVLHDRLVELVAGDADGAGGDDAAEGEDGDLGGAAADVHDHVADGVEHGQPGADAGGHGLLDDEHLAGAGALRRVDHGALLDAGDPRGDGDDDARHDAELAAVDFLDEVADQGLGDVEVGDDAVAHRPHRDDVAGRLADHLLGRGADRLAVEEHLVGALLHGDDGRFREDDALPLHVDQGVAGSQVHPHVLGEDPEAVL